MEFLILSVVALLIAFYYLNEIADVYFIPSLDKISRRLNMSDDAAGATFMAAGSSAPELFIAVIALLKSGADASNLEIGVGTIVGSALFNLLVIIGAAAWVKKSKIAWQPMLRDLVFYLFSIIMLYWAFSSGTITLMHGIIFIAFYILYVLAVINWRKIFPYTDEEAEEHESTKEEKTGWKKFLKPFDRFLALLFPKSEQKYVSTFIISIVLIAGLSWVLVESAVHISDTLGVPKYIIALTILAFGTSVPDMISSIIVAKQGRGGMAVSNALGSNVFDILIGLGLPWMIHVMVAGNGLEVPTANLSDQVLLLMASIVGVLVILLATRWWINRRVGFILIGSYVVYLIYTIYMGSFA